MRRWYRVSISPPFHRGRHRRVPPVQLDVDSVLDDSVLDGSVLDAALPSGGLRSRKCCVLAPNPARAVGSWCGRPVYIGAECACIDRVSTGAPIKRYATAATSSAVVITPAFIARVVLDVLLAQVATVGAVGGVGAFGALGALGALRAVGSLGAFGSLGAAST